MSASDNKSLIKSFVEEVFNKHNISAAEKYFANNSPAGSEGFKQLLSALFQAFPDMQTKIEHIVAENDLVVAFMCHAAIHKGEFRGRSPTYKRVNILQISIR